MATKLGFKLSQAIRACKIQDLDNNEKAVLRELSEVSDNNGIARESISRISSKLSISESTCIRKIKSLCTKNYLSKTLKGSRMTGMSNVYLINTKRFLSPDIVDNRCIRELEYNDLQRVPMSPCHPFLYIPNTISNTKHNYDNNDVKERTIRGKLEALGTRKHIIDGWVKEFGAGNIDTLRVEAIQKGARNVGAYMYIRIEHERAKLRGEPYNAKYKGKAKGAKMTEAELIKYWFVA